MTLGAILDLEKNFKVSIFKTLDIDEHLEVPLSGAKILTENKDSSAQFSSVGEDMSVYVNGFCVRLFTNEGCPRITC